MQEVPLAIQCPLFCHVTQIARFEDITFDFCECVDARTGEELRHPKGECVVPGLVVVKIIYTAEEAERRKAEDREVIEVFEKTRKQARRERGGGGEGGD